MNTHELAHILLSHNDASAIVVRDGSRLEVLSVLLSADGHPQMLLERNDGEGAKDINRPMPVKVMRDVAQQGSADALGASGRRFDPDRPD